MIPLRLLLVDDHTLLRKGLHTLLQTLPGIQVVAEAGDGPEALRLIREHQPDVVLMDISMNGLSGLEATKQAVQEFPRVRVIILSMHLTEAYVLQAVRVGAAGYLPKDTGTQELESAIHTVAAGQTYFTPAVSNYLVTDYLRQTGGEAAEAEPLTARQREILRLIATGHPTQKIANTLSISAKTVETHRAQLMERLDIRDVAGLVRYAIRTGLVTSDE